MAILILYSQNPNDGDTTFNQTRFYEADDAVGTNATLIGTSDLDLSALNPFDPGFTVYVHRTGSTAKFYASAWYNSLIPSETDKSAWIQGGLDRWDTRFENEMADTSQDVWTQQEIQYFKDSAIDALYPEIFFETVDTSLTIVNNSTTQTAVYTMPFGIFHVSEVAVGDPNDPENFQYKIVRADNWRFEKNQLHFLSMAGIPDGYPIRMVAHRKFLEVGELPERIDNMAMLHMRMDAYIQLADDFPRFKRWGQLQKGTKVSFENLRVHAREFERKFDTEKRRMQNLFMSERDS